MCLLLTSANVVCAHPKNSSASDVFGSQNRGGCDSIPLGNFRGVKPLWKRKASFEEWKYTVLNKKKSDAVKHNGEVRTLTAGIIDETRQEVTAVLGQVVDADASAEILPTPAINKAKTMDGRDALDFAKTEAGNLTPTDVNPQELTKSVTGIEEVAHVKEAAEIYQQGKAQVEEIKNLKEGYSIDSAKVTDLIEEQVSQIDGIAELKNQDGMSRQKLETYKKLIEQYKSEKAIQAEMKEKAKDLATDVVLKNQAKVDESMKKISRYKYKYSSVQDMRTLPKRPPNPMKGLGWRERVILGFTFQILTGTQTWLEIDPQVYYRINGNLSAGVGGMYRFTADKDKIRFGDFGSMHGSKVFAQYSVFKGFFVRAEGQQVIWKPWDMRAIDPGYTDKVYVVAAGIGKSYSIAQLVKGNMQFLYHKHWGGSDPYRPVIMMRIGFDLSLKKKEKKPWEEKLREMKKTQQKSTLDRNKSRLKYTAPKPNIDVPKL
jgi:hypothetical protein